MGWQDRDYNREDDERSSFGGRLNGQSVVTWLLLINIIVFLLDSIFTGSRRASSLSLSEWGYFSVEKGIYHFQVWRWFTYQFLHADFFHVLFNMITLVAFGPMMEKWWGTRRFIVFYLLCGIGALIVFIALSLIPGLLATSTRSPIIGASGCIFGILVGAAIVAPRQVVNLLFPPVSMQLRTLALFFLGIAVISVIAGSMNAGGEAAHLGGAAAGFFLMKRPGLLQFADRFGGSMQRWKQKRLRLSAERDRAEAAHEDAEVDRILAKVKEHGLQSLTDKEKKTLQHATERQRRVG